MDNYNIGNIIAKHRKEMDLTQEQLADKLGITAQSVSKWENGVTSPDISLLSSIARIFNISTDELLGTVTESQVKKIGTITNKEKKDLKLKINIVSAQKDKVNVQLPYTFVRMAIETGIKIPSINSKIDGIDFNNIFECVEMGMLGKIVDIESADGDIIEVTVE